MSHVKPLPDSNPWIKSYDTHSKRAEDGFLRPGFGVPIRQQRTRDRSRRSGYPSRQCSGLWFERRGRLWLGHWSATRSHHPTGIWLRGFPRWTAVRSPPSPVVHILSNHITLVTVILTLWFAIFLYRTTRVQVGHRARHGWEKFPPR